jgi:hypothetical protein
MPKCDLFCERVTIPSPWEAAPGRVEPMEPLTSPHYCTRLHTPRRSLDFQYATESVVSSGLGVEEEHHALIVQAARRPDSSSLDATLKSLQPPDDLPPDDRPWRGPKLLCLDGIDGLSLPGWFHFSSPSPASGSAISFIRSLRLALALDSKLEAATIIEDDVAFCRNFLPYSSSVELPSDAAFVTWYTHPYDYSYKPARPQALHPSESKSPLWAFRPSRYFILSQCCTLPRRTVDKLLSCPHVTEGWHKRNGRDEMISWALGDALYATHFPILVQHTGGLNSAVLLPNDQKEGSRSSPFFVGESFDALSLLT